MPRGRVLKQIQCRAYEKVIEYASEEQCLHRNSEEVLLWKPYSVLFREAVIHFSGGPPVVALG